MSFSPTTSGTDPARMAVASWLVSSLGGVRCRTTLRFLWVALNLATSAFAGPEVACRSQKCTVPVAPTPNVVEEDVDDVPDEPHAAAASAVAAATASTPRRLVLTALPGLCPGLTAGAPRPKRPCISIAS